MDVGNLYEENTKMKTRGMYLCKIFFIKSMFLNLYLFCMGGDLNGGVVEFPGAMGVHRTTVHSGSAMVLGICYGCHEGCFLDYGCAIVLDF